MFLRRTVYFKSNKKIRRAEKYKRDVRLFYLGLSRFFGGLEAVFGVGDDGKGGKGKRQKGMDSPSTRGMTGGGGVYGGRLFTALRFVHGYRETAGGDRIRRGRPPSMGKLGVFGLNGANAQ